MQAVGFAPAIERDQQLELERILHLAHRHHLTDAAEERVAGNLHRVRQRQLIGESLGAGHPPVAEHAGSAPGVPMRTNSRMRKDCRRSSERDGSRRKQSAATSKIRPPAGTRPRLATRGYTG